MRKRSFVAVAFAALLAVGLFGLAGCTGSGTYQPELKSAEVAPPVIGEEGTLRVGVNKGDKVPVELRALLEGKSRVSRLWPVWAAARSSESTWTSPRLSPTSWG